MKKTIHFISNTRLGGMITFFILLIAAVLMTYYYPAESKDFHNPLYIIQFIVIGIAFVALITTPFTNKPWVMSKYLVKMKLSLGASIFIAQAMYDRLISERPHVAEDVAKVVGHDNKMSYIEFLTFCKDNDLLDSDLCNHVKMRLMYEELIDSIKTYMHEHPDSN